MVDVKKFLDKDLYGMLGIEITAEEAEVKKNSSVITFERVSQPNDPFTAYRFEKPTAKKP